MASAEQTNSSRKLNVTRKLVVLTWLWINCTVRLGELCASRCGLERQGYPSVTFDFAAKLSVHHVSGAKR